MVYQDNQTYINYKRELASDLIKQLPIDMRKHYYELCLNITNTIVKAVSQPVIFAGGTGQLYSLLKHNFKNTEEFFAFGDIDL